VKKFRDIVPFLSHFSLALMLSILANGVLFFHSHELNGKIITHAHPILTYEQESLPDHGHTEEELIILDLIEHADYIVYQFEVPVPELVVFDQSFYSKFTSTEFFAQVQLGFDHRGPPAIA
jgi:hypothetical protein